MIHIYVKFKDAFSFCIIEKIVTRSEATFEKMKKDIGKSVSVFDKKQHIRLNLTILEVRQARVEDYKETV